MIKAAALIEKFRVSFEEKWGYIYGMKHVMWSQARQDAYVKAYSGDSLREKSCKYGAKWNGHIVTDCSGLFAWWIEQLGDKIAHGSNSIYDRYCRNKGTMKKGKKSSGADLLPGTAVFTTGSDGRHGHIGLYAGAGKVIEAKGAQFGVTESKVTDERWKAWGELKMVEYDGAEEPPWDEDKDMDYPTIRRGSKGKYVTLLQVKLKDLGYDLGKWGADGDFGAQTEKALKEYQRKNGLAADGIYGPRTWEKLNGEQPEQDVKYKVTIKGLDLAQAKALLNNYPGSEMTEE
ncbi:MAG: peptidoglycan-binding protein [Clostridiales bacterium]|nr:peptidoglycan-binding protein [Clostridiales bacterium]